ncbi:MAG: hypothetical protein IT325_07890, partial [Anaerolineae bacterium]|nr:hypothetical protein [Anaerolineae bacterium]
MKKQFLGLLIAAALALGSVTPALAQPPQPAIITFQSSLPALTVDEAEAGTQTTEL